MSPPHNDFTEVHSLANTKANDLEKANPTEAQNWSSFSLKELTETATTLLKFGLPTSMGYICEYASGLVCLRYAGKYGTPSELAGAALGFTWNRMFGVGIISSINQGFSVHAAQLYGAKKYRELGLLLQKNLFVLSIVLIPLLLSFYFADSILMGCGINPEVSINAGIFLRNSMLSVVGLAVFECLRFYLIAQNFFYVQSVVQGSLSVVHIFWCNLFVVGFGMPVSGVAIAKSITDLSCAAAIWVYIKFKKDFAESWIQWESACLEGWFTYLKKMLVIGANIYVEWVSYEISLIIISMLNDESILGAHGIALTLISSFYMLPMGNSYTMQAYIGNAVGEGSVKKAQKFMFAGLGLNAIMTGINVIIMLGWNDYIASCFTNDEETKTVLQTIILIYGCAHMVDTNLGHVTGILKILGGEKEILVYFCLFYAVIAVNCEWIFGVLFGFGYQAIWGSFILGMCLMCGWAVIRLIRIDWKQEVAKVQQRIGEHKNDEDKYYVEMNEM